MRNVSITVLFLAILLFVTGHVSAQVNVSRHLVENNIFRNDFLYPPKWEIGQKWQIKTSRILVMLPTSDNPLRHIQSGWIITEFSVKDIEVKDGRKTYIISMQEVIQEDGPAMAPPGTQYLLRIDEDFVLRSVDWLPPTIEISERYRQKLGSYGEIMYAKEEGEIRNVYKARHNVGYCANHAGIELVFPVVHMSPTIRESLFSSTSVPFYSHTNLYQTISTNDQRSGFTVKLRIGKEGCTNELCRNITMVWEAGKPWWSSIEVERADGGYHYVSTLLK